MKIWFFTILVPFVFGIGLMGGCSEKMKVSPTVLVWRASNDYGDKPGSGIELTLNGDELSGKFFILEPEKPHNFDAGRAFSIRILERRALVLVCEVQFNPSQVDKFILKLPKSFPQDDFVATTNESEPGTTPIEFTFKRVK